MPELPDVETFSQYVNKTSLYQRIEKTQVESTIILSGISPGELEQAIKHKKFNSTYRHGKYLFIEISDKTWLLMHFGMTGELEYFKNNQDTPKYTQVLITFENGNHLSYISRRKLGRISLVNSPDEFIKEEKLGIDALKVTEKQFIELAQGHRMGAKSWLMNQEIIAGIGNIYSDEILFQARLHPNYNVSDLVVSDLKNLYKAMHSVLKTAIKAGADIDKMPADFLLPHRKKGARCPRCDSPLVHIQSSGRTAWYCPNCQKI